MLRASNNFQTKYSNKALELQRNYIIITFSINIKQILKKTDLISKVTYIKQKTKMIFQNYFLLIANNFNSYFTNFGPKLAANIEVLQKNALKLILEA